MRYLVRCSSVGFLRVGVGKFLILDQPVDISRGLQVLHYQSDGGGHLVEAGFRPQMAGDAGEGLDRILGVQAGAETVGYEPGDAVGHGRTAAACLAEADENFEGFFFPGRYGDKELAAVRPPLNRVSRRRDWSWQFSTHLALLSLTGSAAAVFPSPGGAVYVFP